MSMRAPSYADAYQVLLLQAADEGRGPVLFGESFERAYTVPLPFMVGEKFPSIYLEHPLLGDPFLDVTVLYSSVAPGTRIASDMVEGTDALIDWCAETCKSYPNVCFGFEVDTKDPSLPAAAVHFQPRAHEELVAPFCEAAGEPERAHLYLDLAKRLPKAWPLSFFGMFRGRPGAPLRVCGYLSDKEYRACAADPNHVAGVFDTVGFTAYDEAMISQVAELLGTAPGPFDFQFDVYPDGSLGNIFAIDAQFSISQPEVVRSSFACGACAPVMRLLEDWGIADERWRRAIDATFARALPVELEDGSIGKFTFTLMPQWLKVRWVDGVLQPAKLYFHAHAGILDKD